ncbi:hypothetical protein O8C83_05325 [Aliarcobacter butzleri]|uniref:pertactin-like passenger domain-containing protein n=1 Tax=Aliarcobacter butzleri TaxID=28197 RepID=UPI00263CF9FF|nr:pertactin-like passenger domain-containing protein [Aliarcobacter butzleri]MDN5100235.1 hypothetical protein [Aliarcobacter butzleri]
MKLKKLFVFILLFNEVSALNLVISSNNDISGDYSNNTNNGIIINSSNSGNPWLVNIISDVKSNNNSGNSGIYASGGKVSFFGNGSTNLYLEKNGQTGIYVTNSILNIYNTNIYANENNYKGVFASTGAKINILGNGSNILQVNGNKIQDGIHASASNSSYIEIKDMNIESKNNGRYGISSHNSGAKVYISGNGNNTLILENNKNAGVFAGNTSSSVTIENMKIFAKDNLLFNSQSTGKIYLNNVITNISDNSVLFLADSGEGYFDVNDSILSNEILTQSSAISNVTLKNTTWKNIGKSNISNLTLDNIKIYMNTSALDPINSDKLTILKSSIGNGILYITHIGNDNPDTEVMVVDQSMLISSDANANFSLYGGKIDDGALEYELFKGSNDGVDTNSFFFVLLEN